MAFHCLIRPTMTADPEAIARIADDTELFPGEMLGGMIADYFDGAASDIWLTAEDDGEAVGFAFCQAERFTNGTWNLLAIGVTPVRQGQGIGARLMQHLEARLRGEGQRVLIVDTSSAAEFARTRSFYAANGYTEEARIRAFWDVGVDKVTFWKRLSGSE